MRLPTSAMGTIILIPFSLFYFFGLSGLHFQLQSEQSRKTLIEFYRRNSGGFSLSQVSCRPKSSDSSFRFHQFISRVPFYSFVRGNYHLRDPITIFNWKVFIRQV